MSAESQTPEALIVPGGGLLPDGSLPPRIRARCDRALAILESIAAAHQPRVILLSRGTVHKAPPLDGLGFPRDECESAAEYLIAAGVPAERLLLENIALDTIGNAYFTRVLHTDPLGLRRLLVVNSAYHMERTRAIFNWVFALAPAHPEYKIQYDSVSDESDFPDENARVAREKKEKRALTRLAPLRQKIETLRAMHDFIHQEHDAYRAGGGPERESSAEIQATY